MSIRSANCLRWLCLLLLAVAHAAPASRDETPANRDDPAILAAGLVQNRRAVSIRTCNGTQIFDDAKTDTAFAEYNDPLLSPDGHAAAWLETQASPVSDASYPEPTGAWLFAHGHLVGAVGCDSGMPFDMRFSRDGRTLVLVCSFPHGEEFKHEVSFDTASGKCLSNRDVESGQKLTCDHMH